MTERNGNRPPRPPALTDEKELAIRATSHNAEAFGSLYDRYITKIFQYIYYKVGSTTEAEDLTAQVFLRAWESIGSYEWREHPFSAWLFRIARNLVVDYHRARREGMSLDEKSGHEFMTTNVIGQRDDDDPAVYAETMFANAELRTAVQRLNSDEQQEVIVLRFMEGLSTAEIAGIMGKREGAIRGLQFRALAALRETINLGIDDEPR